MRITVFMFAGLLISLTACQSAYDEMVGSGPLALSKRTKQIYQQYLNDKPMAFAVSQDGQTGVYYHCPPAAMCVPSQRTMLRAIKFCEERSGGKPCKILAVNQSVVWEGYTDEQAANLADDRLIEVDWGKYPERLYGTVTFHKDGARILSSKGHDCTATQSKPDADLNGTWEMTCTDGTHATGTYHGQGRMKGDLGLGTDDDGNEIRYAIAPAELD